MRIWVDPFKLQNYRLTFADVKSAIQAQNAQVSAGQLGSQPAAEGQPLTATVTAQSRLQNVDQFKAVILRTNPDGSRSEEHTSELQSLMRITYAVFCLKKKQRKKRSKTTAATHTQEYY